MVKSIQISKKNINFALPHQAQIRRWYSKIPAEPGFTGPAFDALHASVLAAREKGQEVVCSLVLDEMEIRKYTEWDGKKYRGFVDPGNEIDDNDSFPIARDALLFMEVAVNST